MLTLFKLTKVASVVLTAAMFLVCWFASAAPSANLAISSSTSAVRSSTSAIPSTTRAISYTTRAISPTTSAISSTTRAIPSSTRAISSPATASVQEYTLPQVVRLIESVHFGQRHLHGQTLDEFVDSLPVSARFNQRAGVFVTLSSHGKTRACWGNVFPHDGSILRATEYATIGALTKEYRYAPVKRSEWQNLKAQVTVIRAVEPIDSIRLQNPLRDGLLVRAGGKAGVLLPGEAADAHYQLVQSKLKAGIRPAEPCQIYRLRTEIYE